MLNQPPIFLGGQGGLVGPCRLAFGTVIGAGSICRKDELRPGRLLFEGKGRGGNIPFLPGLYRSIQRAVLNNLIYIANLFALKQWYRNVRAQFVSNEFPELLLAGLEEKVNAAVAERIRRFRALSENMPQSIAVYQKVARAKASPKLIAQKDELFKNGSKLEAFLTAQEAFEGDKDLKERFLKSIEIGIQNWEKDYISVIKGLNEQECQTGTRWLQGIVDHITSKSLEMLPSFA
jgi:UDP-N-acetylglucosamine/UDP-N-acetylgalactosamine diphosphorylase